MKVMTQATRLYILIAYVIFLLLISYLLFGTIIPPSSEQGLWFYSCLASIILGDLLVSPYFTKPADAISNAVAAIIALLSVNAYSINLPSFNKFLWTAALTFSCLILLTSILSIVLKDANRNNLIRVSRSFYVFATELGTPRWVFSAVFLYSLVSFHAVRTEEFLLISFAWLSLIAFHPLEYLINLIRRIKDIWFGSSLPAIGEVMGYQFPKIALIKDQSDISISFGDTLLIRGDDGRICLAIALDQVGFTDASWLRVLQISDQCAEAAITNQKMINSSSVSPFKIDPLLNPELSQICEEIKGTLVGIVAPETDITKLKIEIIRTDLDLQEGRLVQVDIAKTPVLYQLVNGLTKEEILEQKNNRGYVRGEARKLGQWNGNSFDPIKWVPYPNSPVFLVNVIEPGFRVDAIGHIPCTDYFLEIDVNQLTTHNAAILGILGIGKTFLALELIERMIKGGIKVVCLDMTPQYSYELAPYYFSDEENKQFGDLQQIGYQGKGNVQQNVEDGGSIKQFKQEIINQIREFLSPNNNRFIKIYNPTKFEVWRQDSKLYDKKASMATLTPCEITRIISEACLEMLQTQGMSDVAKCCLVFEEAHSLVPEWNSAANEGDKTATNGTAKAILQGRKYGLGCLIITQRTANVTKSILNQCNTIFALRSFDATGIEFLKNFIGADYTEIISTLEDRHAIVFGKASSCNTPILIRLNERDCFLEEFREQDEIPVQKEDEQYFSIDGDLPF
jgi:uncharacterized protein